MNQQWLARAFNNKTGEFVMLYLPKGGMAIGNFEDKEDLESWEFWTGRKDKKGTNIFEGDILEFAGAKHHKLNLVFFDQNKSRFMLRIIGVEKEEGGHLRGASDWEESFAVVGNIHQNPELLK